MLSRPRNPPSKRFLPNRSLRFTHQVKLSISFRNTRLRNGMYVTEEQRSRRPIFSATLRAARLLAGCFVAHPAKIRSSAAKPVTDLVHELKVGRCLSTGTCSVYGACPLANQVIIDPVLDIGTRVRS